MNEWTKISRDNIPASKKIPRTSEKKMGRLNPSLNEEENEEEKQQKESHDRTGNLTRDL